LEEDYIEEEEKMEEDEVMDLIDEEMIKTLAFICQMSFPSEKEVKKVEVPLKNGELKRCVVLDMDETLLSAVTDIDPDFYKDPAEVMPYSYICRSEHAEESDRYKIKVTLRPHVKEVLEYLAQEYVVVVFTAGVQVYADPILDQLDPDRSLFSLRLYRQHCTPVNHIFVKDLRVIHNFDLQDIVLVDNSILSFAFQLSNGIPINDFNGLANEADD
jgi:Dullard-like phosphatase family protein